MAVSGRRHQIWPSQQGVDGVKTMFTDLVTESGLTVGLVYQVMEAMI